MILSDRDGFIFIKSQKTLGASIEVDLSRRVESSRVKRDFSTNGMVEQAGVRDAQRETSWMAL